MRSKAAVSDSCDDKTGFSLPATQLGVPRCAPQVRIERKLFPHVNDELSFSTTSSVATSDSRDLSDLLHAEPAAGSSRRTSLGKRTSATASSTGDQTPVQLTPKEAPSPLTPFLPAVPPNSPHCDDGGVDSAAAFSVTLPRCKKDSQKFSAATDQAGMFGCYGPTMTIDRKCKTQPRPVPPVPPVRRLPSWVSDVIILLSCSVLHF